MFGSCLDVPQSPCGELKYVTESNFLGLWFHNVGGSKGSPNRTNPSLMACLSASVHGPTVWDRMAVRVSLVIMAVTSELVF
jgi:hypothetical protein